MIEIRNVTKVYPQTEVHALQNLSVKIEKGEFVFLIGATGAGKSTLMKLLLREEVADDGQVLINGQDVKKLRGRNIPKFRRGIGVVFQDFRLLPDRTVYENIAFAMQVVGASPRKIRHIVPQVLSLVGLEDKADAKPGQLSGGEQQRVSMARALVNNPPLLIADEPTGNLDPETSDEIMELLERINRLGTTVLVATHARELVNRMQKRVLTLEKGRLIRDAEQGGYQLV
ncbi:MAG: cell division ATP-binding protein FtsE [Clostridia bacterium]|nr:cell division ATP-binding protein FtsE [Clostridia bacterium]